MAASGALSATAADLRELRGLAVVALAVVRVVGLRGLLVLALVVMMRLYCFTAGNTLAPDVAKRQQELQEGAKRPLNCPS
jgi:hypothetical protein